MTSCQSTNYKQLDEDELYDVYVNDELVFTHISSDIDYKWTDDMFCLKNYFTEDYKCYFSDDINVERIKNPLE